MKTPLLAMALLCAAAGPAMAQAAGQAVWRCGASYSDRPCPDGTVVQVSDRRSAAEQDEARAVAQRERAVAELLRAQRLERQAAAQPAVASISASLTTGNPASLSPQRPRRSRAAPGRHPGAERETWRAAAHASR